MREKKYPGDLGRYARPAATTLSDALLGPKKSEGDRAVIRAKNLAKLLHHEMRGLELLCEHYKIDATDPVPGYMLLACHLARDHVPYFQEKQGKRGPKVDRTRMMLLEFDIAIRRRQGDRSDAAAIDKLCEGVAPWEGKNADSASLARRRREHKNDIDVKFARCIVEILRSKGLDSLQEMRRILSGG